MRAIGIGLATYLSFAGGVLTLLMFSAKSANAACAVSPNTVTCGTTTTTNTTNTDAGNANSSDATQSFTTNGAVTAGVNSGAAINGFGLQITNSQAGANGAISFNNLGSVTADNAGPSGPGTLTLNGGGGLVTYTGNGSIATNPNTGNGLEVTNTGGGSINVNTGTGNISGISLTTLGSGTIDLSTSGNISQTKNANLVTNFTAINTTVPAGGLTTINVTGGSVTASGDHGVAIQVQPSAAGAQINISRGTVSSSGDNSVGIFAQSTSGPSNITVGAGTTVISTNAHSIAIDSLHPASNTLVLGTLSAPDTNSSVAAEFGGTLSIGNGGTTGTLIGNVIAMFGGTLRFNRSDNVTYGGAFSGTNLGSLDFEKNGSGTLTLTGTGDTGTTTANAGTLLVNGSLSSTNGLIVQNNAVLGGTGSVQNTTMVAP